MNRFSKIIKTILPVMAFSFLLLLLSAVSASADAPIVPPPGDAVYFIKDDIPDAGPGLGQSADDPFKPDPHPGAFDPEAQYPKYYLTTSLYQAAAMLRETGGTIVICGQVTIDNSKTYGSNYTTRDFVFPNGQNTIRITSVYNGVDYRKTNGAKLIISEGAEINFNSAAILENLDIVTSGADRAICFNGYTGYVGEGVNCYPVDKNREGQAAYYVSLVGGSRYSAMTSRNIELFVNSGTYNKIVGGQWGTVTTDWSAWQANHEVVISYAYRNVSTAVVLNGSTKVLGRICGTTDKSTAFGGSASIRINGGSYECDIVGGSDVSFTNSNASVRIEINGGDFSKIKSVSPQAVNPKGLAPATKVLDLSKIPESDKNTLEEILNVVFGFETAEVFLPQWYTGWDPGDQYQSDDPVTVDPNGRVIFVKDGGIGDGSSASSPLSASVNSSAGKKYYLNTALYQAIDMLKYDGGTIVICGQVKIGRDQTEDNGSSTTRDFFTPFFKKPIKFTSVYNGIDYRQTNGARLVIETPAMLGVNGESVWENINIATNGNDRCISFNIYSTLFGDGVSCIALSGSSSNSYVSLSAGHRYNALSNTSLNLTVRSGTYNKIVGAGWGTVTGNSFTGVTTNLTLEGSTTVLGEVCGSIPKTSPFGGYVNITINGGTYKCEINGGGPTSFTNTDARVNITVRGGTFTELKSLSPRSGSATGNAPASKTLDLSRYPEAYKTHFAALVDKISGFDKNEIFYPDWYVSEGSGNEAVYSFRGDANGDDRISSSDIVRLKKYFASLDPDTGRSSVKLGKQTVPSSNAPYADPAVSYSPSTYKFIQKFEAPEGDLRRVVLDHMLDQAYIEWTPAQDFTITWKNSGSFSVNLPYYAGRTYRGLPYSGTTCSLDMFEQYLDGSGRFRDNTYYYEEVVGNNCSQSMVLAFQQLINIPLQGTLKPNSERRGLLMFPVDENGNELLNYPSGDNWFTAEVKNVNTEEAFYEAYARLDEGDILYKSVRVNGHTRLVDFVKVVRNRDGSINPSRSLVYTVEQTNAFDGTGVDGVSTTWWIDHAYTFKDLYDTEFMPVTLCIYNNGTRPQDAYIAYKGSYTSSNITSAFNGTVTSNFPLNYVLIKIFDQSGACVRTIRKYDWTAMYTLDLSSSRSEIFGGLSKGTYTLTIRAGIARGGCEVENMTFTVG